MFASADALPLALALSCAGLAFGPALLALGRGRSLVGAAVDGLTLGLVPAIIVVRLLPHVYESLGPLALGLALFAYLALWLFDRAQHRAATGLGDTMILSALLAHAVTDGMGLASAVASTRDLAPGSGVPLVAALLVHRLPEGLFIATTLVPRLGWRRTLMRLLLIAATSVAAAIFGHALLDRLPDALFEGVVALGLGAMLRLVLHSHASPSLTVGSRLASGLGFLAGLAFAILIPAPHGVLRAARAQELPIIDSLIPLFVETAPAVLVGLLVAGVLRTYLPRHQASWLSGGTRFRQALRGARFDWPAHNAAVLPMMRGLSRQAAPAAAVLAFAISAPELGADSAFISLRLLGASLTVVRIVGSVAIAVGIAWLIGRNAPLATATTPLHGGAAPTPRTGAAKLAAALREGFVHTLDDMASWYLMGLSIAAALEAAFGAASFASLALPMALLLAVVVSSPLYLCAQGLLPIAAVLIHKGLSPGAALALLFIGPTVHAEGLSIVAHAYGRRVLIGYLAGVIACAIFLGAGVGLVMKDGAVPALHDLVASGHGAWARGAAVAVAALFLVSLLRNGPRAWFAAFVPAEPPHPHHHA